MGTSRNTPLVEQPRARSVVEEHAAAVDRARAVLAEWEARRTAAAAELASLRERVGAEVLDAPGAVEEYAGSMQQLERIVDIATRAVAAQEPRVTAVEMAYVAAEADALEASVLRPAQEALAKHEARTTELLEELEKHEGKFVPELTLILQRHDVNRQGPLTYALPRSQALRGEVTRVERQLQVLRAMAAGEDPQDLVAKWQMWDDPNIALSDVYPACVWGPDALVPAVDFQRRLQASQQRVADLKALAERLPDEIDAWEQAQAEEPPGARLQGLENRRVRERTLPADLEQAERDLAELTGASDA